MSAATVPLLLAGCSVFSHASVSRAGGPATTPHLVLPPGSTQPFDAIRGDLLKQFDDALRNWDFRCATEAGYKPVPVGHVREPFHDLKFVESDFGTTDMNVARRDGLLAGGALIDPSQEASRQTEKTAEAIHTCDVTARDLLGTHLVAAYDQYVNLANDMASQYFAKMSDKYQPYRMKLYTCVETKGWHADDIQALSRDSDIRKHYRVVTAQVHVNEATGKETYLPTTQEVSLAVALAACRQQTGYSKSLFQLSRQTQGQVVSPNEAKLAEANTVLEQAVTTVTQKLA